MPIVHIHILEGRSEEQKATLVEKMTDAICESIGSEREAVKIVISDMKLHDYAIGGELIKDRKAQGK